MYIFVLFSLAVRYYLNTKMNRIFFHLHPNSSVHYIKNQWRIEGEAQGAQPPFCKITISVIYDKIRYLTEEVGKENTYKCSFST